MKHSPTALNKLLVFGLTLGLYACQMPSPKTPDHIEPAEKIIASSSSSPAHISDRRLPEISGLASSHLQPGMRWVINDSGNSAKLYLLGEALSIEKEILLSPINRDWEDLTSYVDETGSWIVLAETGDNARRYSSYHLYFFNEERLLTTTNTALEPDNSIEFQYEDGAQNCEAIVVDTEREMLLLFTKSSRETKAYSLPLSARLLNGVQEAKQLAVLPPYSNNPSLGLITLLTGVNLDSTTSAALSEDNKELFLLTYRDIWRYSKSADESWQAVFSRTPKHFASHSLKQAEAMSIDRDTRSVIVTSEELPAPVLTFPF